jgi:hypothetical protein
MSDAPKRRGRPPVDREAKREPKPSLKMRAAPNWEDIDPNEVDNPDRLHIPRHLIPEGMDLLWVTDSVLGQPFPQHRSSREKRGWTPVHQEDFDGQFDGMFMPKGAEGEIKMTGTTLMARPLEISLKAKRAEQRAAMEQVAVKEQALRGGDVNVTLDGQHPTALQSNKIHKSIERLAIPED